MSLPHNNKYLLKINKSLINICLEVSTFRIILNYPLLITSIEYKMVPFN